MSQLLEAPPVDCAALVTGTVEDEPTLGYFTVMAIAPLMQAESARGTKFWQAFVVEDPSTSDVSVRTVSFATTKDGYSSPVVSDPKRIRGKNKGKSNETTDLEQAVFQIGSDTRKKKDKQYWPFGEEQPEFLTMPMTAKTYGRYEKGADDTFELVLKDASKIKYPAYAQPKLDGMRLLCDGEKGWSRALKVQDASVTDHVLRHFDIPEGVLIDGEFMLPMDEYTFQETTSVIKRITPEKQDRELIEKLRLYAYDCVLLDEPKAPFSRRYDVLNELYSAGRLGPNVELVYTRFVDDVAEVEAFHDTCIDMGYEGVMIRNAKGVYKATTTRSSDLQKLKKFIDEEYLVVGYREGEGSRIGTPVFTCAYTDVDDNDDTFEVQMNGPVPYLQRLWAERDKVVGEPLTCRFFEYTDKGAPRFPRGTAVRDYEG